MLQENAVLTVVAMTIGSPRVLKSIQAVLLNLLELHSG